MRNVERALFAVIGMVVYVACILVPLAPAEAATSTPKQFVTDHRGVFNGASIRFTATAGETYLYDPAGEPVASIFSFAYVKAGAPDPGRPVLFIFGGGPGSSSLFLHAGFLGPWGLPAGRLTPDPHDQPGNLPPFTVVDNTNSVLDVADLVFIDPVGTGFSRALGAGEPEDFWGIDEDADAVAQFIQLWLTQNGRWNSPKFVLGESYGSIRASIISQPLLGGPYTNGVLRGITLDGIILLATVFDLGQPAEAGGAGDVQGSEGTGPAWTAALQLPSQAATAWYHATIDREGRSIAEFHEEVSRFATTDYVDALRREASGTLADDERVAIVSRLTAYTGLPAAAFEEDLAITGQRFATLVLADRGLDVGLYDSRFTFSAARYAAGPVADDPALSRSMPAYVAAFHQLLRDKLGVRMDRPYGTIVWRDLLANWDMTGELAEPGLSFATDLASAMRRVPGMRVLVTAGYHDLVTPAAAARHALDLADVPGDVRFEIYEGGHELYVEAETATVLADDIRALLRPPVR